jgi:SAM-dependent methyltransferase
MPDSTTARTPSTRKRATREFFDRLAAERARWIETNAYFYDRDMRYLRFLVPTGSSVLEIGCGTGHLLNALRPARGVGIDLSPAMVDEARSRFPELEFLAADAEDPDTYAHLNGQTFDYIILSDVVGLLDDCELAFSNLQAVCSADTRIIVSYYSHYWEPILSVAELLKLKMPQME